MDQNIRRRRKIPSAVFFCMLVAAALTACTVGPNYRTPATPVPGQWSEAPAAGVSTGASAVSGEITNWWTVFDDSMLNTLIFRAVQGNNDLRLAETRIREARAQRRVVAADAYPAVDASGSYTRIRRSENTTVSSGSTGSGGGGNGEQDLFQAGFDASWEIDLFGGVRRAVEAADADIAATEENRRDVLVTLLSEVARNYMEVRGNQLRLSFTLGNIKAQQQTLDLTRERLNAGLGNELEVAQADAQLTATEAQVPTLDTAVRQAIHRLGVLLGREPGILLSELTEEAPLPPIPQDVPVGLPSELLRRRPDIRRAERELAAATARIGVATADLFPRFFLTGALNQQSANIADFARPGSTAWSFGPTVSWPVFDAGRIRANIEIRNAQQERALVTYEQTVLTALEDVENSLVAYSREQATRRSLARSVDSNRRAVEIAQELYSKGLTDFLNVLDSQRSLFQSQDSLAQSDQRVATNLVALFKALGGGWDVPPRDEYDSGSLPKYTSTEQSGQVKVNASLSPSPSGRGSG